MMKRLLLILSIILSISSLNGQSRKYNIVVIKVDGKWMELVVEALPENINYNF